MKSTDLKTNKEINVALAFHSSEEAIRTFIADDERQNVMDLAEKRIADLKANPVKQGQTDEITKTAHDFKEPTTHKSSVITIRNGKAVNVFFDEKGREVAAK
jgi:hypothetical protein